MQEFIAIDFEIANPKRVSACALGLVKVQEGEILESREYIIKPVGGHAPFQSKIHGIKDEHTCDKPEFNEIYIEIQDVFKIPIVAHSRFDSQVLNALSDHYNLGICFEYTDSSAIAKEILPELKNHKLKTLVKHFKLPSFKHHIAKDDAIACAKVFMSLRAEQRALESNKIENELSAFQGFVEGILADDILNDDEAVELKMLLAKSIDMRISPLRKKESHYPAR